jgi:hypothetical protein
VQVAVQQRELGWHPAEDGRDPLQPGSPPAGVDEAVAAGRLQPVLGGHRLGSAVVRETRRLRVVAVQGPQRDADLLRPGDQLLVVGGRVGEQAQQRPARQRGDGDQAALVVGAQHLRDPQARRPDRGQRGHHVGGRARPDHLHVGVAEADHRPPLRPVRDQLRARAGDQPVQPGELGVGAGVLHQQVPTGEHVDGGAAEPLAQLGGDPVGLRGVGEPLARAHPTVGGGQLQGQPVRAPGGRLAQPEPRGGQLVAEGRDQVHRRAPAYRLSSDPCAPATRDRTCSRQSGWQSRNGSAALRSR